MKTVMVVDDDPDIQLLLKLELQAEGYHVVTASNGREALEYLPAADPDCMLLDVMMPEIDGWEVLERLPEPKPAVIVVSGLATDRDQHFAHAIELGALGFVSKPFEPATLLAQVAEACAMDAEARAKHRASVLHRD